jgi:hypothetical protein
VKEVAAIAGEYPARESPFTAKPFAVDSDVVERLRAAEASNTTLRKLDSSPAEPLAKIYDPAGRIYASMPMAAA